MSVSILAHSMGTERLQASRIAERLIRYLPQRRVPRAQHVVRRRKLERYLGHRLGSRYAPVPTGPVPPSELLAQTSVWREEDLGAAREPDRYLAGGYLGTMHVLEAVERFGFDIRTARTVLDFGCGGAKNLRLLRGIRGSASLARTSTRRRSSGRATTSPASSST